MILRQAIKTDSDSGIVNAPNLYAPKLSVTKTMNDPAYPYLLLCRIVTVSLETVALVKQLGIIDLGLDDSTMKESDQESQPNPAKSMETVDE